MKSSLRALPLIACTFLLSGCIEEVWRASYQPTPEDSGRFEKVFVSQDGERIFAGGRGGWPNTQATYGTEKYLASFTKDGTLRWEFVIGDDDGTGGFTNNKLGPVFAEDAQRNFYVALKRTKNSGYLKNVLYKFDENGTLLSSTDIPNIGYMVENVEEVIYHNGEVLIAVSGQLLAYSLDGELLWHFQPETVSGVGYASMSRVLADGTLVFVSNNYISTLSPSGALLAQRPLSAFGLIGPSENPPGSYISLLSYGNSIVLFGATTANQKLLTMNSSLAVLDSKTFSIIGEGPSKFLLAQTPNATCFYNGVTIGAQSHASSRAILWSKNLSESGFDASPLQLSGNDKYDRCEILALSQADGGLSSVVRIYDAKGKEIETENFAPLMIHQMAITGDDLYFASYESGSTPLKGVLTRQERREDR